MPAYGSTNKVRLTASRQYVEPARRRGESKVEIHSGVLNKVLVAQKILPPNRLPIVCNALKSTKFLEENHLVLEEVKGPPSGSSSTVTFVYRLKPAAVPAKRESLFLGLRGVFKGVYDKDGGPEAFLREQRDEFDRELSQVRRIFWDAMLFVYWFNQDPNYSKRVGEIYRSMVKRGDMLLSSSLVLSEVIVGPCKASSLSGIDRVEAFFNSAEVTLLPYPLEAARIFARLRAVDGVKGMDAIHLATAAHAGTDLFLTNDRRLHKLVVPGIKFIATLDADLF